MSATLQLCKGSRLPESQMRLEQALRALRGIRQRYELGRNAHPRARFYSVNVVVDCGDVAWLSAAIEAMENAIGRGSTEAAGRAVEALPEI